MKAKIESVKPTRTFGDPPVQVYEVVAGGVVYDCMDKKCTEMVGKEVEFNVKEASDPKYHPRMSFPKEGGQFAIGKGGRGYQIAFGQTAEGEKLRTKAMVLSYAKDIVVQYMAMIKTDKPFTDYLVNLKMSYDSMISYLRFDQIGEQPANDHKSLSMLLAEMKPISSLDAFSSWWKTIHEHFNHLSSEDQKTLIAEKDKKKTELSSPKTTQNGRQPNF